MKLNLHFLKNRKTADAQETPKDAFKNTNIIFGVSIVTLVISAVIFSFAVNSKKVNALSNDCASSSPPSGCYQETWVAQNMLGTVSVSSSTGSYSPGQNNLVLERCIKTVNGTLYRVSPGADIASPGQVVTYCVGGANAITIPDGLNKLASNALLNDYSISRPTVIKWSVNGKIY